MVNGDEILRMTILRWIVQESESKARCKPKIGCSCRDVKSGRIDHNMPESFRALWRMVSLTAANTSRMLLVSVACVKWGYKFRWALLT